MEAPTSLAETLRRFMQRVGYTPDRLAKASTVPKPTIVNWLEGRAKKPRDWQSLLLIAGALDLNEAEASRLLQAARHHPIDVLRLEVHEWLDTITSTTQRRLITPYAVAATDRVLDVAYQRLAELPLDTLPAPTSLPPGSRMLLHRNALFVGRKSDLRALAHALRSSATVAIAAATGIGGIGKTQLAAEFVHRYGHYFAGGVFWLSFADPASVPAEIAACGAPEYMALHSKWRDISFDEQVRLVQSAWQSPLPRLLVFDNCESEALLQQWRPTSGSCHVLVTSRRAQWNPTLGVEALSLDTLPREESVLLLRKHCSHLAADDQYLQMIAEEVGDLPLALHVAGHYLARYRYAVTPSAYVEQLRTSGIQQLSVHIAQPSPTRHVQHVERTFALSYERLDPASPIDALARALLARVAWCAPGEPVPRDLLLATLRKQHAFNVLQIEDALARLVDLGLVDLAAHGALRLHRLVAAFVQDQHADETAQADVEYTLLDLMNQYNDANDVTTLVGLHTHLHFVTDRAAVRNDARAADLCEALGYHLWLIGRYSEAQPYLERALAIRQQMPTPNRLAIASAYNLLALVYQPQCQFQRAQALLEEALVIWLDTLGPDHERTVAEWNNLGYLHLLLGNYDQAEQYFMQALRVSRRICGLYHTQTARLIHNLGYLSVKRGWYRRGYLYLALALRIRQRILPTIHVSISMTLLLLSEVTSLLGDYDRAWSYGQQSLDMRIALFGEEHEDPAESYYQLGRVLHAGGEIHKARSYLERAADINAKFPGSTPRVTAYLYDALGAVLRDQGQYRNAYTCFQKAMSAWNTYNHEHPELVHSLNNLAALLLQQGNLAGARKHLEGALAICSAKLRPDHPDTALTLKHLGDVYYLQGDANQAQACYQRALAITHHRLGRNHSLAVTLGA